MGELISDIDFRIGQIIKRLRTKLKLTQIDVANDSGLTQPTISHIENGDCPIRVDRLILVCQALKTSASAVLREAERQRL
jgi:transcriptional regulator with XRE-family HTH domain